MAINKEFKNNLKGSFNGVLIKLEENELPSGKKVKNGEILTSVGEGEKQITTNVKFSIFEGSGMFYNPLLNVKEFNNNINNGGKRPFVNIKGANMESYPSSNGDNSYPNLVAVFTKNTQIQKVEKGMNGFKNQAYLSNAFIQSIGKSEQGFFINLMHKASPKTDREGNLLKNQPNNMNLSIFVKAPVDNTNGIIIDENNTIKSISVIPNNEDRGFSLSTDSNAQTIGVGDRVSVNVSFPYKTTAEIYQDKDNNDKFNVTMHTSFRNEGITIKATAQEMENKRENKAQQNEVPEKEVKKEVKKDNDIIPF